MIRRVLSLAVMVGMGSIPLTCAAAQGGRIFAGSVLRVRAPRVPPGRFQGTLIDQRRDSLTLMTESDSAVTIGLAAITAVQVRTGTDRAKGAVIGALTGAGIGALGGWIGGDETSGFLSMRRDDKALIFGTLFAVPGALIGAVTGKTTWADIALPLDLALGRTRSGASVTMSIRF